MKTSIFNQIRLWLSIVCATMMLAACSNDDSSPQPSPEPEVKTIFYTASVGDPTRATVESDNKTIHFATGDKLYVQGTNISGVLDIQTGAGTANATFSGTLTYTGEGSPADDLVLNATLVGTSNAGVQFADGKVTGIDYSTAICVADGSISSSAVNEAVKKYSYLTGSSKYGDHSFSLTQHTAFLNFTIKVPGTAPGVSCAVSVAGVGGGTGSVISETSGDDVVLKFVAPVATQTLSSASVMVKNQYGIPFGGTTTLTARVYNISKTIDVNHEYVDLGLPTGTKWAKTNLGAATETGYGNFYAWGGTTGYSSSDASDHTFNLTNAPFYSGSAYTKYTTENEVLGAADDAATQSRGAGWRIPTKTEFEELLSGTDVEIVMNNEQTYIRGFKFTNKSDNTKYIFLPAAGRREDNRIDYQEDGNFKLGAYWLSTRLHTADPSNYSVDAANAIGFSKDTNDNPPIVKYLNRYYGMTIRPVYVP